MADLSSVVEYDRVHIVSIKKFDDGSDLGIKIGVVSKDSKRVTEGLREWQASNWEKQRKAGESGLSDVDVIGELDAQSRETLVHAIVSWDWGEHSWNHLSGASDAPSIDDKRFLVNHPNAKWLVDQVAFEVADIENFTQASPKIARRGSRKT